MQHTEGMSLMPSSLEMSGVDVALEQMHYFRNHPFQVRNDEKMTETVESVKQHGILVPSLVRPDPKGGYEIVSGHRRHMACSLAGFTEMPAIVWELSDDEVAESFGISGDKSQSYIRLTYLVPELLAKVDNGTLSFSAAVDVSHLTELEQKMLLMVMERDECASSGKQVKRLKEYSQQGRLLPDVLDAIMTEEKPLATKIMLDGKKIQKFTPKGYTPKQMEEITLKLLENWYKKHQQKQQSER